MRLDSQLAFVPSSLSMVAAAGDDIASTNVIDFLGNGVGTEPTNLIGNATVFGQDPGVGDGKTIPKLQIATGVAFTTGTSATLNVAIQYAADDGSNQPSTWYTAAETGELAAATLTAAKVIARLDVPPMPPQLPQGARFMRLLFQIPAGTLFTAGTIAYAGIVPVRDDQANKYAAKSFTVA